MGRSTISLDYTVEEGLFDKRKQAREKALSEIIQAFTEDTQHEAAQKKFATIMFRCLSFLKKGSAKEICLATKALGLLAMNLGPGDNGHELYEESLSTFPESVNSKAESVQVLECLAIVTLVGANDFWDTERTMKTIWQFTHPDLGSNIRSKKLSAPVLAAAISSWSFLLATADGRELDHKYWQGAISDLLNLLEEGELVQAACVDALCIIFEKGCDEKFSTEAYEACVRSVTHKEDTTLCLQEWKDKIKERVQKACGHKWEILKNSEGECGLETSINFWANDLKFSAFSYLKKVKFIKQFLGDGFEKHMQENELLHQVFDFKPKNASPGPELYVPETEEVNVRYFSPDIRKATSKQRLEKSPNSLSSKAKTQLMKKHRMLAKERKTDDFGGDALA